MVKLHPLLTDWLKKKIKEMKQGKWRVTQVGKGNEKLYVVGTVTDFVYDYEHPEYLNLILKIKAEPKRWGKCWVIKAFYMTTDAKNKEVVNGQRPIVCRTPCFKRLIHKAIKKNFF